MTLVEKLADLKAKLKDAKTDDERTSILGKIDDIITDSTKVLDALKKANDEAKTSREEKEALQKKLDSADPDPNPKPDPDPKPKPEIDEPAWAKTIRESVESLAGTVKTITEKDKQAIKSNAVKSALKEAGLPETFSGRISVEENDPEKIKTAVAEYKQELIDNKLLDEKGIVIGEKGNIANENIVAYAQKKDGKKADGAIVGKKLIVE